MFISFKSIKGCFSFQPNQADYGEENIPERGNKNMSWEHLPVGQKHGERIDQVMELNRGC